MTPPRGAGLPMALHRSPAYTRGLLLAGDAAGAVNPFNGEGISYAMETGRRAAETAAGRCRRRRERPARLRSGAIRRGCAPSTAGTTASASGSWPCSTAPRWSASPPRTG